MKKAIVERFAQLEEEAKQIERDKKQSYNSFTEKNATIVDAPALLAWRVKAKALLVRVLGQNSVHVEEFSRLEKGGMYLTNHQILQSLMAIFVAASDDFQGGHLTPYRNLIQAEVFDSEIDQAMELLEKGYKVAAAVIGGIVLETHLRQLCDARQIPIGKLDKMNADLVKAEVYNSINGKRITAIAGIRNSAAHGEAESFTESEVSGMLQDIQRFLASSLS